VTVIHTIWLLPPLMVTCVRKVSDCDMYNDCLCKMELTLFVMIMLVATVIVTLSLSCHIIIVISHCHCHGHTSHRYCRRSHCHFPAPKVQFNLGPCQYHFHRCPLPCFYASHLSVATSLKTPRNGSLSTDRLLCASVCFCVLTR
jgi:hypothetical protein